MSRPYQAATSARCFAEVTKLRVLHEPIAAAGERPWRSSFKHPAMSESDSIDAAIKGEPLRGNVRDLAELQGVSVEYLAKLFTSLQKAGLVVAAEGARGGHRLARKTEGSAARNRPQR